MRRRLARCPRQNLGIADKSVVHGPKQIGQALRSPRLPADHDILSTADPTQGPSKAENVKLLRFLVHFGMTTDLIPFNLAVEVSRYDGIGS